MATLASYSDLKDAICAWLGQTNFSSARSDLQNNIPVFVTMFEATANRRLRTRKMEALTIITTSNGQAALPSDFLEPRRLTWKGSRNQVIQFVEPDAIQFIFPTNPTDTPEYYTIEAGNIVMRPIADVTTNTVTITIASPAVVTLANHGLSNNEMVTFSTTGALPTGLTAGTEYFVSVIDTNTFKVYTDYALTSVVNTSGSQSGTQSLNYGNLFEFLYFQTIPTLTGGTNNWLFNAHPDLYLRGCLIEAAAYGVDNDQVELWKAWRDEVFQEIQMLSDLSRAGGVIQSIGPTP